MNKNYSAEVIAVGTELLLGQIANTNAKWISERLADLGIHVYFHSVVGDNIDRVAQVFQQAGKRSDIVLVTGGLGPTDDDLTMEAFQKITGFKMKEDKSSMERIETYFRNAGKNMTSNNRKQSLVFENSTVFSNSAGMAPGMGITYGHTRWFFTPGVPREMKAIMTEGIIPELRNSLELDDTIKSRMLRFIGIGESRLEHDLKHLIDSQSNPTIAPLASEGEVAIRLTAKARNEEEANQLISDTESKVLEIAGDYFYGYDEESLNGQVISLLRDKNISIAVAESLTGGKFTDCMISVPGASAVVSGGVVAYSPEAKMNLLGISGETIEKSGTVSEKCANEMAFHVRSKLQAGIGISFTGVAGPSSEEGKEPGVVFIAIDSEEGKRFVSRFQFQGDREAIRNRSVKKGLELLFFHLKN